jgi:hypothetical protein
MPAQAPFSNTLQSCSPADILAYVQDHWLPNHLSRQGGNAAPTSLSHMLSHLSSHFESIGRSGEWREASDTAEHGKGNPVLSHDVRQLKLGYGNIAQDAGFSQTSAPPMRMKKFRALQSHIDQRIHNCHAAGAILDAALYERLDVLDLDPARPRCRRKPSAVRENPHQSWGRL